MLLLKLDNYFTPCHLESWFPKYIYATVILLPKYLTNRFRGVKFALPPENCIFCSFFGPTTFHAVAFTLTVRP